MANFKETKKAIMDMLQDLDKAQLEEIKQKCISKQEEISKKQEFDDIMSKITISKEDGHRVFEYNFSTEKIPSLKIVEGSNSIDMTTEELAQVIQEGKMSSPEFRNAIASSGATLITRDNYSGLQEYLDSPELRIEMTNEGFSIDFKDYDIDFYSVYSETDKSEDFKPINFEDIKDFSATELKDMAFERFHEWNGEKIGIGEGEERIIISSDEWGKLYISYKGITSVTDTIFPHLSPDSVKQEMNEIISNLIMKKESGEQINDGYVNPFGGETLYKYSSGEIEWKGFDGENKEICLSLIETKEGTIAHLLERETNKANLWKTYHIFNNTSLKELLEEMKGPFLEAEKRDKDERDYYSSVRKAFYDVAESKEAEMVNGFDFREYKELQKLVEETKAQNMERLKSEAVETETSESDKYAEYGEGY